MQKHYGFDLGDAESAVAVKTRGDSAEPDIIPVAGSQSFVTAFAETRSGVSVGETVCYNPKAGEAKLRFKSRFLTDPAARSDVGKFARAVLNALYEQGSLAPGEDCTFCVGCPAGWDANAREEYRMIFENAGCPPVRIVTESRAALMSACRSKYLQVGYDILSKPMLVVDIGSSTTDFAYILDGREVELRTSGEVFLGGGLMDEMLVELSLQASPKQDKLREVFAESGAWKSYCEFAARRLKEKYFSREDYWRGKDCASSLIVRYRLPVHFTLTMNESVADKLLNAPIKALGGKSFRSTLSTALREIGKKVKDSPPEIVFLTGGVSRMSAIRAICRESFPDAVVVCGSQPEFSVAKGLAWTGVVDEELREFRREIEELKSSDAVEDIVRANIDTLFRGVTDALTGPVLENAAVPVFERWRSGEIKTLEEIDPILTEAIASYLRTDEVRSLLAAPAAAWVKPVASALEEKTIPICVRHGVPYTALSLVSYLSVADVSISIDAKNVFAMDEITWLINGIISVLVGLLCGGSGVALVASGFAGIMAGVLVSLLILFLGKNKVQSAVMSADIPLMLRKTIPKGFFTTRAKQIRERVAQSLYENLSSDKGEEITENMVGELSGQIEECLTRMAQVVELPLQ